MRIILKDGKIMLFKNTWKLYEIVSKIKKADVEKIRSIIGWSKKKTKRHLLRLLNDKVIGIEDRFYFPIAWWYFSDIKADWFLNVIKKHLAKHDKCIGCNANQYIERFGIMCIAPICIKEYDYDSELGIWIPKNKKDVKEIGI